ncbi:related to isoleucine tRNA ligase [Cephalotrichum gorgonifer]|uniref:Isoleucine--tRNA ligase, mitochondrial n=1 Tax=Cephalotrichum gorgonifer TaxID=2041049 RepID=A0AAE8MZS8_9PEZI|nr:related to isoleucine tRNA ligase [Cephalotrichum gorgonifer]
MVFDSPAAQIDLLPGLRNQYLRRCTDDFYAWQALNRPGTKPFVLHDGPPYANGDLHVGHALNKILKDMILRVKVQQGHRVKYVPGWDCHGLPIEMKALGAAGAKNLSATEIRRSARKLASKTILKQMKEFRSYGIMAEWDNRWATMHPEYEIQQLRQFQRMVAQGLIYRKHKPVYWSPSSRTALAEAELEYKEDHISTAAYVRFPIVGDWATTLGLDGFGGELHAVIWTTTPWTLPANRAIAVHDDLEYAVVKPAGDSNALLIATSRLDIAQSWSTEPLEVLIPSIKGTELKGMQYRNLLRGSANPPSPIIHADLVSAESGTGLVHLAPAHGMEDYIACSALDLDVSAPITDDGYFTEDAYPDDPQRLTSAPSILEGGSNAVLELLGQDVLHVHKYKHKYPYDWRTKKPVVIRATAQWFADVESIKDDALAALEKVKFVPPGGRTRLESFVKGRSEWCISRQRAWGVPIPVLYGDDGGAVVTDESINHIIQTIKVRGIDAWFSDPPEDPAWIAPSLSGKFRRGSDTMDVWFDSGTSWTQTEGQADVYLEGSDQHRGWFQSSLLTWIAAQKGRTSTDGTPVESTAPFKTLITHGFTLDTDGRKMSKSIGNTISPGQVMDGTLLPPIKLKGKAAKAGAAPTYNALGADALRLWAASSEYTRDVAIGEPVLKTVQTALVKYRTIMKMLLGSMHESARAAPMTTMDHIALIQLKDVMGEVSAAFDNHEFYKGFSALNNWVSNQLSALYLESLKDRLYCGDGGGVLEPIFFGFSRMLAPMTPLLVEEAWDSRPQWMKDDLSLAHPAQQLYDSPLYNPSKFTADEATLRKDIPVLMSAHAAVKSALETARVAKALGSSLQSSVVITVPEGDVSKSLEKYASELDDMFVVSSVDINTAIPESAWSYEETFEVNGTRGKVTVSPPKQHKCGRCWRYIAVEEDGLCGRCEDVVKDL